MGTSAVQSVQQPILVTSPQKGCVFELNAYRKNYTHLTTTARLASTQWESAADLTLLLGADQPILLGRP